MSTSPNAIRLRSPRHPIKFLQLRTAGFLVMVLGALQPVRADESTLLRHYERLDEALAAERDARALLVVGEIQRFNFRDDLSAWRKNIALRASNTAASADSRSPRDGDSVEFAFNGVDEKLEAFILEHATSEASWTEMQLGHVEQPWTAVFGATTGPGFKLPLARGGPATVAHKVQSIWRATTTDWWVGLSLPFLGQLRCEVAYEFVKADRDARAARLADETLTQFFSGDAVASQPSEKQRLRSRIEADKLRKTAADAAAAARDAQNALNQAAAALVREGFFANPFALVDGVEPDQFHSSCHHRLADFLAGLAKNGVAFPRMRDGNNAVTFLFTPKKRGTGLKPIHVVAYLHPWYGGFYPHGNHLMTVDGDPQTLAFGAKNVWRAGKKTGDVLLYAWQGGGSEGFGTAEEAVRFAAKLNPEQLAEAIPGIIDAIRPKIVSPQAKSNESD